MVYSSSASLRHFYFIFLSAESRASKYRCCCSPSASGQAALGCWERTSWWHEQGGWPAVVQQKAEPVLRKRNNFKRNLSFLVVHDDGAAHWGTTDEMALIAKQRYWGFIPFDGKPGLCCDKFHTWPQIVSKPSLNLDSYYQPTPFYSFVQIRATAVPTAWLKTYILLISLWLIWALFFLVLFCWGVF